MIFKLFVNNGQYLSFVNAENEHIRLSADKKYRLASISKFIEIGKETIVFLMDFNKGVNKYLDESSIRKNVVCIDSNGNEIWRIQDVYKKQCSNSWLGKKYKTAHFTDLYYEGGLIKANDNLGHIFMINPSDGSVTRVDSIQNKWLEFLKKDSLQSQKQSMESFPRKHALVYHEGNLLSADESNKVTHFLPGKEYGFEKIKGLMAIGHKQFICLMRTYDLMDKLTKADIRRNVFCMDAKGNELWRVQDKLEVDYSHIIKDEDVRASVMELMKTMPFTNITIEDGVIHMLDGDGTAFEVNPDNGKLVYLGALSRW